MLLGCNEYATFWSLPARPHGWLPGSGAPPSNTGLISSHGFIISLDDFGTGYSSFAHLDHLPIDEITIDKSFVQRLDSGKGRALVKTIVDLGHALGMNVVAEGVESAESAQLLRELGVTMLQGYYFRAPGAKEECLSYFAAGRGCPATCARPRANTEFVGTR